MELILSIESVVLFSAQNDSSIVIDSFWVLQTYMLSCFGSFFFYFKKTASALFVFEFKWKWINFQVKKQRFQLVHFELMVPITLCKTFIYFMNRKAVASFLMAVEILIYYFVRQSSLQRRIQILKYKFN